MQMGHWHAFVVSSENGASGFTVMEHTGHCLQFLAYLKHRQENCGTFATLLMVCVPFLMV